MMLTAARLPCLPHTPPPSPQVENTGTGNATNVLFTDEVNATISGVTPDTICTFENNDGPVGTVSCTFVDPLAPAGTIEITITASTPNAGLLTNSKATVSADTLDPVPADPATVDVRVRRLRCCWVPAALADCLLC